MTVNVGLIDRIFRAVLGVVLLYLAFASGMAVFEGGWPKYVAAAVGVVMLATALMRICPLYSLIGVRTCRMR